MKHAAGEKILYFDPLNTPAMSDADARVREDIATLDAEAILRAMVDSLVASDYDPVTQLTSYFIAGDPTFLPEDTEARTLAHEPGRDKLLEALITYYTEHRHDPQTKHE